MHHVPKTAFVLSLIGGIFVLLAGAALAALGTLFSFILGGAVWYFYIGLVVGLILIVLSVLLWVKPEMKTAWGALIIVFAIVSLPTAFGGFIVGFILALIGGIFAITYKSPVMMAPPMQGQWAPAPQGQWQPGGAPPSSMPPPGMPPQSPPSQ